MKRGLRWLEEYGEPVLIVVGTLVMVGVICLQIALRFFNLSISWAEELARYLFVWVIYLSVSYAIRDDRHIRVTVLVDRLPPRWRCYQRIFADLLFLIYSVTVCVVGAKMVSKSIATGRIAPALQVPIAVLYASVVVGAAVGSLRLLASIRSHWLNRERI